MNEREGPHPRGRARLLEAARQDADQLVVVDLGDQLHRDPAGITDQPAEHDRADRPGQEADGVGGEGRQQRLSVPHIFRKGIKGLLG